MDLLAQLLVNGLVNGSHYALLGLSFGLIFGPTRITHFAHGPLATLAARAHSLGFFAISSYTGHLSVRAVLRLLS
ncbi:MAG: hypothetical protein EBS62_12070 [Betaproteobacteria bacterium]|nr:hypothetical protein [Betaproteobacteria bacterium]